MSGWKIELAIRRGAAAGATGRHAWLDSASGLEDGFNSDLAQGVRGWDGVGIELG